MTTEEQDRIIADMERRIHQGWPTPAPPRRRPGKDFYRHDWPIPPRPSLLRRAWGKVAKR